MRSKAFIIVVGFLAAVVVMGGALYAYDNARANQIASGVSVGGVPLGGLTPADARARLKRRIMDPLLQPIVVHRHGRTWTLSARKARIRADLNAMVDEALARSRSGDLFSRVWRSVRHESLDTDLQPTVQYNDHAVRRLVRRVSRAVDREPRDASVQLDGSGVHDTPSETGRALRANTLRRQIRAAIVSPTASRTFTAHAVKLDPKVTTADIERRYGTVVIINRNAFQLSLYKHLKLAQTYPIAVGMVGLETPAGQYAIANKAVNPAWHVPNSAWAGSLAGQTIAGNDPSNPIKARWLGIADGVGIHGTSDDASIGHNASHGCIRMHIPDVERLYDEVPVGSPVYIA